MEVLVVDGDSSDHGRAIVRELAAGDPRVRLLRNPRRITPAALNLGIRAARGEILIRVDAHTEFPPDYVEKLVRTLDDTGADMVGGCSENAPSAETKVAHAIAIATSHAFATGSPFRYRRTSGPADAVPFGCWRRSVFERFGLFDERLLRNQDLEHTSRILRRGGRVFMNTEVRIRYLARDRFRGLWQHAVDTGCWNAFAERLHPSSFRWRHLLPGFFFVGVLVAAALIAFGALAGARAPLAAGVALIAPYLVTNVAVTAWLARRRPSLAPLIASVFASYHFTYGFGVVRGWWLVASGGWRSRLGVPAEKEELA
jgi:glycosyltransferase involved in cell wall biosynthesis